MHQCITSLLRVNTWVLSASELEDVGLRGGFHRYAWSGYRTTSPQILVPPGSARYTSTRKYYDLVNPRRRRCTAANCRMIGTSANGLRNLYSRYYMNNGQEKLKADMDACNASLLADKHESDEIQALQSCMTRTSLTAWGDQWCIIRLLSDGR